MMRLRVIVLMLIVTILAGCSIAEKVNHSLNYVDEATNIINNAARLAEELPVLAEQALTDPQARTALKNELTDMKERIQNFNAIEPPAFAKNIHQQVMSYNETLMKEMNGYLEQINNGAVDWNSIKNSQLIDTLNQLTQILDKVQNLNVTEK